MLFRSYYLSSILTENGYGPEKCGVVGEWNLTENAGKLYMEGKMQGGVFLKNGNALPLLSEKTGGEIIRKRGVENGFTE